MNCTISSRSAVRTPGSIAERVEPIASGVGSVKSEVGAPPGGRRAAEGGGDTSTSLERAHGGMRPKRYSGGTTMAPVRKGTGSSGNRRTRDERLDPRAEHSPAPERVAGTTDARSLHAQRMSTVAGRRRVNHTSLCRARWRHGGFEPDTRFGRVTGSDGTRQRRRRNRQRGRPPHRRGRTDPRVPCRANRSACRERSDRARLAWS